MNLKKMNYFFLRAIIFSFFVRARADDVSKINKSAVHQLTTDYGRTWIFFPDGDGIPQYVNLTTPASASSTFIGRSFLEIEYRLYTRDNADLYTILNELGEPINDSGNVNNLINSFIKVVTHGWMSSVDKSAVTNIKNAYLKTKSMNVIAVDWSKIANSINYPDVSTKTEIVGTQLAKFLNALSNRYNISGDKMHLIGHSLGAHVMGIAGSATNFSVGRITGLDPARPLFEFPNRPLSKKLDASDAHFVDVIHSCSGILGVKDTMGDADFYPNNGFPPQPGCENILALAEACSHSMSHFYFTKSILNPTIFPSNRCKSWNDFLLSQCDDNIEYMGEATNKNISGKFYLRTDIKKYLKMQNVIGKW